MARTKIEWTDRSWNPVTGCSPVSEGCENCYARRMAQRLKGRFGYPKDEPFQVTLHKNRLDEPWRWRKPSRIFICSMGDLFHEDVPNRWICEVINAIWNSESPHVYMILTKRPARMKDFFNDWTFEAWRQWPNLWLGVTVENQKRADERIPVLLQIPAAVQFVSIEPMLGPINLGLLGTIPHSSPYTLVADRLNLVIVGAETGPRARFMDPAWPRRVRDDCREADVAFFMKQMSGREPIPDDLMVREWPE